MLSEVERHGRKRLSLSPKLSAGCSSLCEVVVNFENFSRKIVVVYIGGVRLRIHYPKVIRSFHLRADYLGMETISVISH